MPSDRTGVSNNKSLTLMILEYYVVYGDTVSSNIFAVVVGGMCRTYETTGLKKVLYRFGRSNVST